MATPTFEDLKVYWCPTVASIAAPTVANIAAGTDLTPYIPVAGVNVASTTNRASLAMLGEAKIKERIGTQSKSPTLTFIRHSALADDDAWVLFVNKLKGYLVLSYSGAAIATTRVEVYSAETSDPMMAPSAENELQTFTVEMALDDWNIKATVAA